MIMTDEEPQSGYARRAIDPVPAPRNEQLRLRRFLIRSSTCAQASRRWHGWDASGAGLALVRGLAHGLDLLARVDPRADAREAGGHDQV